MTRQPLQDGTLTPLEIERTVAADERIAIAVAVPSAPKVRVRLKATDAADAVVSMYVVGGSL